MRRVHVVIGCLGGVLDKVRVFQNEKDAYDTWEETVISYGLDPTEPLPGHMFAGHSDENDVWLWDVELELQ